MTVTMAHSQRSSFQKKGAPKRSLIKGTSPSFHNSQLLISSGIPSFDSLIGGGIPVGSLILINEDEYGTYSKLMLKYFLAEGVVCQHAIFFGSKDIKSEEMIQDLPAPVDAEIKDENESEVSDKKMTIAWRYENLKATSTHGNHKHFGHYFDLSRKMDEKVIKNSDATIFSHDNAKSCSSFKESAYYDLLKSIEKKITEGLYSAKEVNAERNILRIALHHLNSAQWQYDNNEESNKYVLIFLYSLRALIRNAYVTCYVTLPFSRHKKNIMEKCIYFSDIAIQLQSFAGTACENVAPYTDYHGFFVIQKLAAINSLVAFNPPTSNLAFKLRRKKLVIEAFYLPPELDDSTEREQDESSSLSCSSFKSSKLDF